MPLNKLLIFLILLLVSGSSILAFRYAFLFLKSLLASRLTLFRLSTLLWLGSCIHCILACFLWSKKSIRSSSNHGLCCFSSRKPRISIAEVLMFSLMFSQALFMSSSSLKFSKAANLFAIPIWYRVLSYSSFNFLRLNLSPSNLCAACLLPANLSLISATTRYWSVSQSAPLKLHTSNMLKCHLLSINMWSVWLWVFPSGEFQLHLWMFQSGNIVLLTTKFWCGKVYCSNTIIITILM